MLTSLLLAIIGALTPVSPRPTIAYTLRLDAAHLDVAELAIELRHAPTSVRLAMKVHAEYDALRCGRSRSSRRPCVTCTSATA
jgi:hypothetical protein